MKRVIVVGCPGSGKSVFSRALQEKTGLPLYPLDLLFWNADETNVGDEEFCRRQEEVLSREEWIIDGNYSSTLALRMAACDTVFFLDYPMELCLAGIAARQGKMRPDLPWVENADEEFLRYVRAFPERHRPILLSLLRQYPEKTLYHFHTRAEAESFLRR